MRIERDWAKLEQIEHEASLHKSQILVYVDEEDFNIIKAECDLIGKSYKTNKNYIVIDGINAVIYLED